MLQKIQFVLLLILSNTAFAAPVTVNLDGATLYSNGVDYFIDPETWDVDITYDTGGLGVFKVSGNPEIVGFPAAVNDFNITIFLGNIEDQIATSGVVFAQVNAAGGGITTTIPNADFYFLFGQTGGSWDWVGYDLIFQLDYDRTDSGSFSVDAYGSYNFTVENFFDTENVSAVPIPAAVWLFGSGLLGLAGVARRKS